MSKALQTRAWGRATRVMRVEGTRSGCHAPEVFGANARGVLESGELGGRVLLGSDATEDRPLKSALAPAVANTSARFKDAKNDFGIHNSSFATTTYAAGGCLCS